MPFGSAAAINVVVEWQDSSGKKVPWDPTKIRTRYGSPKTGGVGRDGPGILTFRPTFLKQSIIVEVDLWSEKRGDWKPTRLYSQDVTAFCPIAINDLSTTDQHVVAALFSEGGSNAKGFSREEVIRVMWCFEHRRALLAELDAQLKTNPKDATALARKKFAVKRGWGNNGSYEAVLNRVQIDGVGGPEYKKAKDPANLIRSETECARLEMTMDVALSVITGSIPDPDAGLGNSKAPGCFYYMTKDQWEKNNKRNIANPKKEPLFAPTWQRLPSKDSEIHFYWGIEPEGAFK